MLRRLRLGLSAVRPALFTTRYLSRRSACARATLRRSDEISSRLAFGAAARAAGFLAMGFAAFTLDFFALLFAAIRAPLSIVERARTIGQFWVGAAGS